MQKIGGRAHAHGITFESDFGRVFAADSGNDTVILFSARTKRLKAALSKVPLLRAFVSFGRVGLAIFMLLIALLAAEVFAPQVLHLELYMPDTVFYALLAVLAVAAPLFAVLMKSRIRRLLQHHGAEHMALNTWRAGLALTAQNISRADRAAPSCGSVFVLFFLFIGVPLMFVPYSDFFLLAALCVAFELSVLARRVKWLRPLLRLGMVAQRAIFTRPPDAAQIETARRGLCTLIGIMNDKNGKTSEKMPGKTTA